MPEKTATEKILGLSTLLLLSPRWVPHGAGPVFPVLEADEYAVNRLPTLDLSMARFQLKISIHVT